MEIMELLQALFRWIHVVAGILWIGHLYFFNFVNAPLGTKLDGPTKKVVVPQLMPRALFWFRWGAAWTWITGILLLLLVFYHGGLMFRDPANPRVGAGAALALIAIVVAPVVYDALWKSGLGKEIKTGAAVSYVLVAALLACFVYVGDLSYRAYNIHVGAMFGTIMAFNVWMRIWPAQQKIITAVRDGQAPDAALVALAGGRSKHNTYMSVPLVWTMLNAHTTVPFAAHWIVLLAIIALGWGAVTQLYKEAGKVPGF